MQWGPSRFQQVLQPVSGKALPVLRGEVIRISQTVGGQCVDFNAFNLHDYREHLSVGRSRAEAGRHRGRPEDGIRLSEGSVLFSKAPRFRPMFYVAYMPATCLSDTFLPPCYSILFEKELGFDFHTNCTDTLAEAIREYDLTPDDIHGSFNMFVNTVWDLRGKWWIEWNPAKPEDFVDLVACMDTLSVPVVCGAGDVQLTSNLFLKPIAVEVFEASSDSLHLVSEFEEKYAAKSRQSLKDFKVKDIRVERELRPNPSYVPDYPRFPLGFEKLQISLDEATIARLDQMVAHGFADNTEDAVRRSVMLWFLGSKVGAPGDVMSGAFVGGLRSSDLFPEGS